MFRLTEQLTSHGVVLKLEGRCSFEMVGEIEAAWRAAAQRAGNASIWVDLSDVWLIDAAGQAQFMRMHHAGVRFRGRGCFMRELIREICGAP